MRLLLDTHALLWWLDGSPELSPLARDLVADTGNEVLVSLASFWELGIKLSLGKLVLARDLTSLAGEVTAGGMALLPVQVAHCVAVGSLPFHHRDPFDRLLIAQAQVDGLDLVSRDAALDAYPPKRHW